jgi:hypothetical protein
MPDCAATLKGLPPAAQFYREAVNGATIAGAPGEAWRGGTKRVKNAALAA